jgi:hypothetical protein
MRTQHHTEPAQGRQRAQGDCSGWLDAKSGGFAGLLRVRSVIRAPKKPWADVTRHVRNFRAWCDVTVAQTFLYPEHPEHPEQSRIYAGFSQSPYPEHSPLHPDHPEQSSRNSYFMGKKLR